MLGSYILESGTAYMLFMPDASLGASDHSGVLDIWLGCEFLCDYPLGSYILESGTAYMLFMPDASLGASDHSGVLDIWLGCEFLCEKGHGPFVSCDGTKKDSNSHWESIGRDFLNKMDLPLNTSIQIVTQGAEPEQFLNFFTVLSSQEAERGNQD
ncbi:hypothetical protein DITRI_Ditri12bG0058100 [Diplodiscus trichospermus]